MCAALGASGAPTIGTPRRITSQGRESNPQLRGMNPARCLFLHPAFTRPFDAARDGGPTWGWDPSEREVRRRSRPGQIGLAGLEPATCRIEVDNPRPAARGVAGKGVVRELLYQLSYSPSAHRTPPEELPTTLGAWGSRVILQHLTPPAARVRRCACIDVKQRSMGASETKNAPPAWCAGGASGKRSLGARANARSPPFLRGSFPSAADTRLGRPVYRYVVASYGLSSRCDSSRIARLARSMTGTAPGGRRARRSPGRRFLASSRSAVFEVGSTWSAASLRLSCSPQAVRP